jgi:TolB-like protein
VPDNGHFVRILDELQRRNVIRVVIAYVVTAWLVIQVVETILPAFGFGTAAIRIVTIAFAVGLVPTIIIAWAFELTPEGLKLDSDVDHSRTMQPGGNKKLDRAIMVILALAVGYFAFDKFVLDPARDQTIAEEARQEGRSEALIESFGANSIAVLAFEDMSPEGDQEYLSDGIAEQVLNLLTRIPDLRVISRSSAFSFKGKSVDLPTIAKQLNVAHVLEGSVRRAGDRIRITAQLIEARSDTHLWSQTYDRTLDDIFAIQDEIATAIVERLQVELLTEIPRQQRVNPEAYMRYMQGRYFTDLGAGGEEAVSLLKQALAIEPEFVDAWLELHRAYAQWPTAEMTREQGARLDDLRDKAFSRK